ncbi:tyrosine-type recombinase/integrase [Trueperella pyogenes]|uniref:tyrosine-type recombinase/integrase n=1 Tax=Trueperella pyogenes TaxID=1661 RepID=UPI0021F9AE04|nr:tyrosine-type recombinase/integrase [Trueperella pyogenes]
MQAKFIEHLRAARRGQGTINLRTYYLDRASADGINFANCTATDLERWLSNPAWSIETARSARSTLVVYFTWAHRAGLRADNPASDLPVISERPPCPRPLPEDDYRTALDSADGLDRLAIRLAGEAGLRRSEVAQVHVRDLEQDLLGFSLRVHGKGGKTRLVPLSDSLAREVKAAVAQGGGWAFPSPVTASHVTAGCIGKRVGELLPTGYSMHSLRHRFATVAYTKSQDIRSVQELLGHTSLATTQRYVATSAARLREVANLAA